MRLICFTCAGGTTDLFKDLKEELVKDMEVVLIDYSGHGKRYKESLYTDIDSITGDLLNIIDKESSLSQPYALLGYSMGTIVTISIYEAIRKKGYKMPNHIFLAAHSPETSTEYLDFLSEAMEDKVKQYVIKFGGIAEQLWNNEAFWRVYLPIYQADFHAIGTYSFEERCPLINTPVSFFYSESDTPMQKMKGWNTYLRSGCDFYEGVVVQRCQWIPFNCIHNA